MEEKSALSPMLKPPSGFGKVWYILYPILMFFGVNIAVTIIAMIVVAVSITSENPFTGGDMMAYSMELGTKITEALTAQVILIQAITYFILSGLFILLFIRDIKKRGLYKDKPEKNGILPYIFMVLTVNGFSMFFVSLTNITKLYEVFPSMLNADEAISGQSPILVFVYTAILAPICEELLFRGMIFKRLRGMIPFVPAALISSVLFGLGHISVPQIIYTSILGFLFAYIYEKYGSILVTMFCHFALNTVIIIINYTLSDVLSSETSLIITFIVTGVVFIAGLIPLLIHLKKMPSVLHKMPVDNR
jgi:membrane protease YdiL (CAAX protease family)